MWVVQRAQNWHSQRLTDGLDGTRDRRILLQRQVRPIAISASIAINFLTIKDVTPKISSTAVAEKLEPEKLAEVAKRFTVQVSCE
jgi:hypothetical protein